MVDNIMPGAAEPDDVSSAVYEKLPLDRSKKQIRLLHLEAGKFGEPLSGYLKVVKLSSSLRYQALSYVWGADTQARHIYLCKDFQVPITDNLWACLQRLRRHRRKRVIWVDAICIDQTSPEERGHQVGFMADIYQAAQQVLVWLGDTHVNDRSLQRHGKWMPELLHFENQRFNSIRALVAQKIVKRTEFRQKCRSSFAEGITSTMQNTQPLWHTRAWVYQEFLRARRVYWCFGPICICSSMPKFTKCIEHIAFGGDYSFSSPEFKYLVALYNNLDAMSRAKIQGLHQLALDTIHMHCSNPRDKVYSLLSVADPRESNLIQPDYRMSISGVFAQATYASIAASGSLELLCEVDVHRSSEAGFPTWVVDFAHLVPVRRPNHDHVRGGVRFREVGSQWADICSFQAAWLPAANARLSKDCNELRCDGILVDRITNVLPEVQLRSWRKPSRSAILALSASPLDAVWRQIEADQIDFLIDLSLAWLQGDWGYCPMRFSGLDEWHMGKLYWRSWAEPLVLALMRSKFDHMTACDLLCSAGGALGFSMYTARVGDVLALVKGAALPLVLRPRRAGGFEFRGFAYLPRLRPEYLQVYDWQSVRTSLQTFELF